MISEEKVYEFLTSQVAATGSRAVGLFKIFLQLFSAIVGGSIWLSIQQSLKVNVKPEFAVLSNSAAILTTTVIVVLVLDNIRSWHAYRTSISKLGTGPGFSSPKLFPSAWPDFAIVITMLIACVIFCSNNPFY